MADLQSRKTGVPLRARYVFSSLPFVSKNQ